MSHTALVKTYTSNPGCWHVAVKKKTYDGIWSQYRHEYDYHVQIWQGASIVNGQHRVYIGSSTTRYWVLT